ncbi:transposase domain-containing protein (plasmid) [Bradyrhizobium sp. 186]|uniref:transposase domain-containing protein n=1 Tax=Bradyrhizobium sp. 186 TaxID=2782654 RepID=UPI002000D662|nr:transposase domain-containing protein [Bradyrhizobium sp. 186]UPK40868.1 transposase domain-containing protein [Bradyrhizobium sp. 186]
MHLKLRVQWLGTSRPLSLLASKLDDPKAKDATLKLASEYERLAARPAQRELSQDFQADLAAVAQLRQWTELSQAAGPDRSAEHCAVASTDTKLTDLDPLACLTNLLSWIVNGHPSRNFDQLLSWAYREQSLKARTTLTVKAPLRRCIWPKKSRLKAAA